MIDRESENKFVALVRLAAAEVKIVSREGNCIASVEGDDEALRQVVREIWNAAQSQRDDTAAAFMRPVKAK